MVRVNKGESGQFPEIARRFAEDCGPPLRSEAEPVTLDDRSGRLEVELAAVAAGHDREHLRRRFLGEGREGAEQYRSEDPC